MKNFAGRDNGTLRQGTQDVRLWPGRTYRCLPVGCTRGPGRPGSTQRQGSQHRGLKLRELAGRTKKGAAEEPTPSPCWRALWSLGGRQDCDLAPKQLLNLKCATGILTRAA